MLVLMCMFVGHCLCYYVCIIYKVCLYKQCLYSRMRCLMVLVVEVHTCTVHIFITSCLYTQLSELDSGLYMQLSELDSGLYMQLSELDSG